MLIALWRYQLLLLRHSQNLMMLSGWWLKNSPRSLKMKADCFWRGCDDELKIFLAVWIKSVMTIILEISCERETWLIPQHNTNNSTSIEVILTVWWRVLTTGLLWTWIWVIEDATLFLTLASVITRALVIEADDSMVGASNCWRQSLKEQLLLLANRWKEKQLEKLSMILLPGWNSELRGSNKEKTSLNLLSMSTMCPLMRPY